MLEQVLEKALQVAQEAEVYQVSHQDLPVTFEANRLKMVKASETTGIALRIVKDGHIGFSSTTNMQDVDGLVRRALEMAPFGPPAHLEFPPLQAYPEVPVYDARVESLDVEEMMDLGQGLIRKVRAFSSELLCDARVSKGRVEVKIRNSRGGRAGYTKSLFSIALEGTLVRGTDMLFVGESQSTCQPLKDMEFLVDSVRQQLEMARETAPAPQKEVPVIFTPRAVAGVLLPPLLLGLNGRAVLKGTSPLSHKLGEDLLSEKLSLWDDPTVPFRPGSRICDDEGVPSRTTPLVERGVIAHFLYDLQTAGEAGARSTGSASRSLGSLPGPAASLVRVQEGDTPYEEMVRGLEDGLVVDRVLGAGQSNVLGGDFSGNVLLGYRIRHGRVMGRVKDTMVFGNVYRVLKEVEAVGREARWVGGSVYTPALCCRGVSVSSKA